MQKRELIINFSYLNYLFFDNLPHYFVGYCKILKFRYCVPVRKIVQKSDCGIISKIRRVREMFISLFIVMS